MVAARRAVLPPTSVPWFDPQTGLPVEPFRTFMLAFAALQFGPFVQAANDAAAAKAGVVVGGVYQLPSGALAGRVS
jgi:hypothetical protein